MEEAGHVGRVNVDVIPYHWCNALKEPDAT